MRVAAAWVLDRTLASLGSTEPFLETLLPRFDERDGGLLQELVYGSLRWLRRLDHVIATASNRCFEEIEPALRAPLRIGVYQLLFLDRVPAHAAVHEAVEQANQLTHRGGASFVNAVLRRVARAPRIERWPVRVRDPVERLAIEMSHPTFLVERWLERFGRAATLALLEANNRPKPLHLLAFRDRGGRELLAERLIEEGFEVEPSALSMLGLTVRHGNPLTSATFERGDFYFQDEASQAVALLPPPRPGERIYDAAAAPGGKSFALAAWEPSVRPVLSDVSLRRLGVLSANLRRLGRRFPRLVTDAAEPSLAAAFDRVVLDLPCSGTGTFRKHPELRWRISPEEVGRLSSQALRLLRGVAPLVDEEGLLVAITCSLEREENEDVVERFLAQQPEFRLLPLEGRVPAALAGGIVGPGLWRIFPAGDHDGFTAHVMIRSK